MTDPEPTELERAVARAIRDALCIEGESWMENADFLGAALAAIHEMQRHPLAHILTTIAHEVRRSIPPGDP